MRIDVQRQMFGVLFRDLRLILLQSEPLKTLYYKLRSLSLDRAPYS